MDRRAFTQLGIGLPALLRTQAWAFAPEAFWNTKPPSAWTPGEIQELLTKSPWMREAGVHDTAPVGSINSPRMGGRGRRGDRGAAGQSGGAPSNGPHIGQWKAAVRWESALPIREALGNVDMPGIKDNYVLNMLGNMPGPPLGSDDDPEERQRTLDLLKGYTKLAHKGDEIGLNRVELAPKTALSAAGTLFYFSRALALEASDKEAIFTTRMGTIEVKCKFALKDMVYRGNLAL